MAGGDTKNQLDKKGQEKETNEEVLVCTEESTRISKMIWHRKHRRLGHVLRHENFLPDIIEKKMLMMDKAIRDGWSYCMT